MTQEYSFTPEQIKALREDIGESQTVFGQRFGHNLRAVQYWEAGERTPDVLVCRLMAALRQMTPEKKVKISA